MVDFGSFGARLHKLCRGIDDREVETDRERKSISVEETYWSDLANHELGILQLPTLLERLKRRLIKANDLKIAKIYVKIKFNDFTRTTVESLNSGGLAIKPYEELFIKGYNRYCKPIRLIGLGGVRLQPVKEFKQLTLDGF